MKDPNSPALLRQPWAPEPAVAYLGALRRLRATGTVVERFVQLLQSLQGSFQ